MLRYLNFITLCRNGPRIGINNCTCKFSSSPFFRNKRNQKKILEKVSITRELDELLDQVEDKILFNTIVDKKRFTFSHRKQKTIQNILEHKQKIQENSLKHMKPLPTSLKYFVDNAEINLTKQNDFENLAVKSSDTKITQFPFEKSNVETKDFENHFRVQCEDLPQDLELDASEKLEKVPENWMSDYDVYSERTEGEADVWKMNYGTPDVDSVVSDVPCGGCGSLLHCKVDLINKLV